MYDSKVKDKVIAIWNDIKTYADDYHDPYDPETIKIFFEDSWPKSDIINILCKHLKGQ